MNPFIRSKAREDLKGNWGIAILAMVVLFILSLIVNQVPVWLSDQPTLFDIIRDPSLALVESNPSVGSSLLSLALSLLVLSALQVGYYSIHIKIGRYETASLADLFSGFRNNYMLIIITTILVVLLSFAFMIPAFIAFGISLFFTVSGSLFFSFIFILVGIAAGIWGIIKTIPLSMVPYELANENSVEDNPVELIKSIYLSMDGNKAELVFMGLSFIPWMILVVITLGLAGFYVFPYMQQSFANFYDEHC